MLPPAASAEARPTMSDAAKAIDHAARVLVAARGHYLDAPIGEDGGWAGECSGCGGWVRVDRISSLAAEDWKDAPISGALVRRDCSAKAIG
jgi:hypothetical protein